MFGVFRKADTKSGPSTRAFGAGTHEWQPSRTVEPFYDLKTIDEVEYGEFTRRAAMAVEWSRPEAFAAGKNEPGLDKVEADFWWWAKIGDELWILEESVWAYFPDPLPYSLSIRRSTDSRFQNLGHFAVLPTTWTNGPQQVQS